MTAIRYQPGASYEEQLRIWANGNEDEHRLAVFLEESVAQYVEVASEDSRQQGYDDGYSEGYSDGVELGSLNISSAGYDDGYSEGYSDGYSKGYAEGRGG